MLNKTVALALLHRDVANTRTIDTGADAGLIASIAANGLTVPLIVRSGTGKDKGFVVIDGGRRLDALQQLLKAGTINDEHPVDVTVVDLTDEQARERSLTVNINRQSMHPVDEFRAFNALHTNKAAPLDVQAIATRFGLKVRQVEQRLALGALADVVLDGWKAGYIDREAAEAFTLCPDKKQQATLYAKLAKEQHLEAWAIKRALKVEDKSVGRALEVVGRENYEKRGGKVTLDLFGKSHTVSNTVILKKLLDETVAAAVAKLKGEGWSFVLPQRPDDYYNYGHLAPTLKPTAEEKAEIKRLEKLADQDNPDEEAAHEADLALTKLNATIAARGFDEKQRAKSGVFITFDDDGLQLDYGVTAPAVAKAEKRAAATKGAAKKKGPPKVSQALGQRLLIMRNKATKAAMLADKHPTELSKLAAGIVSQLIDSDRAYGTNNVVLSKLDQIRNSITPKLMNEHQRKAFDAKDFFSGAPKAIILAAITEAVSDAEGKKLGGKKGKEIAAYALAHVTKTGWLPVELRFAGYDGPGKKGGKAK